MAGMKEKKIYLDSLKVEDLRLENDLVPEDELHITICKFLCCRAKCDSTYLCSRLTSV